MTAGYVIRVRQYVLKLIHIPTGIKCESVRFILNG